VNEPVPANGNGSLTAQPARETGATHHTMENNNGIAIIKAICHGFVERAEALNLKGKKRDDAAMDYFVGANRALVAM
jgi:hypothetical protein